MLVLTDQGSLHALLSELEWNYNVALRNGVDQAQYRVTEFERFLGGPAFHALTPDLRRAIPDAYMAISNAQSLVRSYEVGDLRSRADLGGEMIIARVKARPATERAECMLREFLGSS